MTTPPAFNTERSYIQPHGKAVAEHLCGQSPPWRSPPRRVIGESIPLAIEAKMFDAVAADDIRPKGLRNGIAAETQSGATGESAMAADIATLIEKVAATAANAPVIFIASPVQAGLLRLWNRSNFNYPVLASSCKNSGRDCCKRFGDRH